MHIINDDSLFETLANQVLSLRTTLSVYLDKVCCTHPEVLATSKRTAGAEIDAGLAYLYGLLSEQLVHQEPHTPQLRR